MQIWFAGDAITVAVMSPIVARLTALRFVKAPGLCRAAIGCGHPMAQCDADTPRTLRKLVATESNQQGRSYNEWQGITKFVVQARAEHMEL